MLTSISPKLPMRDKAATLDYYVNQLGFAVRGDHDDYLLVAKDGIEIHFFEFKALDPGQNYGQVYIRTDDADGLYRSLQSKDVAIHPNGHLQVKP